jgi:hypothetical protein
MSYGEAHWKQNHSQCESSTQSAYVGAVRIMQQKLRYRSGLDALGIRSVKPVLAWRTGLSETRTLHSGQGAGRAHDPGSRSLDPKKVLTMHAVIIGGMGHIGSYLPPMLIETGYSVTCVCRNLRQPYRDQYSWSSIAYLRLDRAAEEQAGMNEPTRLSLRGVTDLVRPE